MSQNPYDSPSELPAPHAQRKIPKWRGRVAAGGWLVFFLLPTFGVFASHAYPGPPFLDAPRGDTVLSRVSLALGVPMEPLLFGSLLGCAVSAACLPIARGWKATAILAWLPLAVLQVLELMLALLLLGYPPVT